MGRPQKQTIGITDLYPGLNDIGDAFEALPQELVRYFTLLKEIDAKCVTTVPHLKYYIRMMLSMKRTHPKRKLVLSRVQQLLKELMPCLEEKMHVASIASDAVSKHLGRIDDDWDIIVENEIPESVRIGPLNHPAMIQDSKLPDGKSAHSARSESRREALAAKRSHVDEEESGTDYQRKSPGAKNKNKNKVEESEPEEPQSPNNEPLYCYCNQVSYGEMVGCDGPDCAREWFHLPCIGLTQPPRGKWYCDECKAQRRR